MWRYFEMLPVKDEKNIVSLEEAVGAELCGLDSLLILYSIL